MFSAQYIFENGDQINKKSPTDCWQNSKFSDLSPLRQFICLKGGKLNLRLLEESSSELVSGGGSGRRFIQLLLCRLPWNQQGLICHTAEDKKLKSEYPPWTQFSPSFAHFLIPGKATPPGHFGGLTLQPGVGVLWWGGSRWRTGRRWRIQTIQRTHGVLAGYPGFIKLLHTLLTDFFALKNQREDQWRRISVRSFIEKKLWLPF